jgi:hypothetical protein
MAGSRSDRFNLLEHAVSFAKKISGSDYLMSGYEMLDIDTSDIGSKYFCHFSISPFVLSNLGCGPRGG